MLKSFSLTATAALSLIVLAGSAQAEGAFSFGAALTSDYVADGETQTGGKPAFQPYIEYDTGFGVYAGVWASNVDAGGDKLEYDVYLGYAGEAGAISYDISYTRFYYDASGFGGHELAAGIEYPISGPVSGGSTILTDLDGGYSFVQALAYDIGNGFEASGEIKQVLNGGATIWNAGISKSFTENLSLDLRYHDSTATEPRYTLALAFDTDFNSMFK